MSCLRQAKAVVNILLAEAEKKRHTLTIILAGYKDEIESKVYGANPGFKSRFRQVWDSLRFRKEKKLIKKEFFLVADVFKPLDMVES